MKNCNLDWSWIAQAIAENMQKNLGPGIDDLQTVLLKSARIALAMAVEDEVRRLIEAHRDEVDEHGHRRVIRNGHLPERNLLTGLGPVPVKVPRVLDRCPGLDGKTIKFISAIVLRYRRRTNGLDRTLASLYLYGLSTNNIGVALRALLGPEAEKLSPSLISRLKEQWHEEYERFQKRDLSGKEYVYWWADGVYLSARGEQDKVGMLAVFGVTTDGKRELVKLQAGWGEDTESWRCLLRDLKAQGVTAGPRLAVADGGKGFRQAMAEIFPETRLQLCWVHKERNVMSHLPKAKQQQALGVLRNMMHAQDRSSAERALARFKREYEDRYPKAVASVTADWERLTAFFDFPAAHWRHLQTNNNSESVFATMRLRTNKTRGCLSPHTTEAMVYKLVSVAQAHWRRLNHPELLEAVRRGDRFIDGEPTADRRECA